MYKRIVIITWVTFWNLELNEDSITQKNGNNHTNQHNMMIINDKTIKVGYN